MNSVQAILASTSSALWRGRVLSAENADILVEGGEGRSSTVCALLQTSEGSALRLSKGDVVLCVGGDHPQEIAIVLGRISQASRDMTNVDQRPVPQEGGDLPEFLVLEARSGLILKVGDGSITIREDGKILIKGTDLVSHAKKMNRIRGGSVTIN